MLGLWFKLRPLPHWLIERKKIFAKNGMSNPATITLKGSDGVCVKIAFNAILVSEIIRQHVETPAKMSPLT